MILSLSISLGQPLQHDFRPIPRAVVDDDDFVNEIEDRLGLHTPHGLLDRALLVMARDDDGDAHEAPPRIEMPARG